MLTIKHTPELTRLSELSNMSVENLRERIIKELSNNEYIADYPDDAGNSLKTILERNKILSWVLGVSIFHTITTREVNHFIEKLVLFWDDEKPLYSCEECGIVTAFAPNSDAFNYWFEMMCQNPNCKEHGKTHRIDIQKLERDY